MIITLPYTDDSPLSLNSFEAEASAYKIAIDQDRQMQPLRKLLLKRQWSTSKRL